MANITQTYLIGEAFNAYTSTDLSTSDWKWTGRTLSCFMKEDGTFVDLGGALNYDTPTASLSGVWTLNKSEHPLKIYLIGDYGRVTVRVTEKNENKPLASVASPYWNTFETTSAVDYYPYFADSTAGCLSIDIIPDEGTIVKSVTFGNTPMRDVGAQITTNSWDSTTGSTAAKNRECGLSVEFTTEGILTYYPGY